MGREEGMDERDRRIGRKGGKDERRRKGKGGSDDGTERQGWRTERGREDTEG